MLEQLDNNGKMVNILSEGTTGNIRILSSDVTTATSGDQNNVIVNDSW